jgi:hypothetical protein
MEGYNKIKMDYGFSESTSKSSFRLEDVKGFIYGGLSSRFWMMRKQLNYIKKKSEINHPFYSWQCISLQLDHRDIDLVIKDDKEMAMFLRLLAFSLVTLDGKRDSAQPLINALLEREIKLIQKETGKGFVSPVKRDLILGHIKCEVLTQAYKSLKLMMVRHKISYSAFQKGATIPELFFRTILSCLEQQHQEGLVVFNPRVEEKFKIIFPFDYLKNVEEMDLDA